MYKGERDPRLALRVPQSSCYEWVDSSDNLWIEVVVPALNPMLESGGVFTFMVHPSQVFYVDEGYNEVHINAGAYLKVIERIIYPDGRRVNGEVCMLWSEEILARLLHDAIFKIYHTFGCLDSLSASERLVYLYQDFVHSGYTLKGYVENYGDLFALIGYEY